MWESAAWRSQAVADDDMGTTVENVDDGRTYAHAAAKYQQSVEKAVKAVVVILRHAGIMAINQPRQHRIDMLVTAILAVPRAGVPRDPLERAHRLFSAAVRRDIRALDDVAPAWPAAGALHAKNTEYPYQVTAANWLPPADASTFTRGDMKRFRYTSRRVSKELDRIVDALELLFP